MVVSVMALQDVLWFEAQAVWAPHWVVLGLEPSGVGVAVPQAVPWVVLGDGLWVLLWAERQDGERGDGHRVLLWAGRRALLWVVPWVGR